MPRWRSQFDVAFQAGGITAVIGPSGSGKSTLLNLIAGFETPLTGQVLIADADVTDAAAVVAAGVDDLPGEQSVCASRCGGECRARHLAGAAAVTPPTASRIATALGRTGLAGKEKRLPRELSGGERQRVALARALVRDRPVLLLDEPFASLGPALRDEMLDLLVSVQEERQMTTLLVTHQPEDARRVADGIVFRRSGAYCRSRRQAVVLRKGRSGGVQALRRIGTMKRTITLNCPEADII